MTLQQPGQMKVWKSPVFYFGVLLVMAVAGLLLAPVVIDWNGYRSDLEAYGKKLTGREVAIDGRISARLFPWPRLTAEQVSVSNPSGFEDEHFATAERITLRMTLAGLMQGGIDVESIDVEQPTVRLERRATGEGNWIFTPSADLIRSDILSRVRLDQIMFTGGTIHYRDRRRDETVTLDDVNANIASPGVTGPWRLRSQSLYNDRAIDISLNTGSYVEGEPFRFGVKLSSADGSGYVFGFDGEAQGGKAEGQVRIEPARADDGKSDAEGRVRPLLFTAKVAGDFERVDFRDVEVSRLEPGQNGAITTGSASLALGSRIHARADLKAAMLDLDELAGAQSRNVLRQAGGLGVAGNLLALLPGNMELAGRMGVTALKSGGQNLDNVELEIAAERDQLRIGRFAAGLPGRSKVLFSGLYAPGRSGAELNGQLALETEDLRELAFWLWEDGTARLGPTWTGDRGRLRMETDVSVTASHIRLANADFELDGERGKGSLSVTSAGRGAVELALEGSRFDLDAYAPQGIRTLSVAAQGGAGGLLAWALPRSEAPDLKLRFTAGELQLNAVTASGVTVDLQSSASGLDLRTLEIGSVGGAKVEATGLILDTGRGADGSMGLVVEAGDPSELIRLLGLAGGGELPAWAQGLGATAVRASLAVKPSEQGSEVYFRASGNAGELNIAGEGTALPGMALSGNLAVTAPSSARILSLLGLSRWNADNEPGALRIELDGKPAEGFSATATLQAHGARFDYRGKFDPQAEGYGVDGQLSLKAADAASLIAATGIPAAPLSAGLSGEARLVWGEGKWTLSGISGLFGEEAFSGSASLAPTMRAEARISTGPLRLGDVMAATLLDWTGPEPSLETGFAAGLPFGLTGEVWLSPSTLEVMPNFAARAAEVAIEAKPGETRLVAFGKDEDGRSAQVEFTSVAQEAGRKLTGHASLPLDLGRQLATVQGAPVAEGQGTIEFRFESEGRSPAGALAAMRGEGSYEIDGFRLLGLTPADFTQALAAAKDAAGIAGVFDALRSGQGLDFGSVSGKLDVKEGQVNFTPVTFEDANASVEVRTLAELALGQIDMDVGLRLKAREGLPPMSVSYAGPPRALSRGEDNSELATALGVTIMQEGIDELERLQQEQERLAKLEEQQRIEDEARLQAYYAQRDELLLRRRELKVHAEMQVAEADRLRRQIEVERAANAEINKSEVRQRLRELRTWRRLARLAERPKPAAVEEPVSAAAEVPAAPKPPARQAEPRPPQTVGPVILARPPGAPVVISKPPGESPSQ